MRKRYRRATRTVWLAVTASLAVLAMAACVPATTGEPAALIEKAEALPTVGQPESTPTPPPLPTAVVETVVETPALAEVEATPAESTPAELTPAEPTPVTAAAAPEMVDAEARYAVAFVSEDESVPVYKAPGADHEVTAALEAGSQDISLDSAALAEASTDWLPVALADGEAGWVEAQYLVEEVDSEAFCQDSELEQLVEELRRAIADEDDEGLAGLVAPARGLRVRYSWWNPEVHLVQAETETLFSSATRYAWGVMDGSGAPVEGTFSHVILPLLQSDLLPATVVACNEIPHGPTAGMIEVPDGYQSVNFLALHRPAGDEIEFDWGTWIVGVDRVDGRLTVSFLVHYAYEI